MMKPSAASTPPLREEEVEGVEGVEEEEEGEDEEGLCFNCGVLHKMLYINK